MNILITSASRKASLVKAFQRALVQQGGGSVIAVDASPLSPALYCADEYCIVPADNEPGFLEEMLRLCREKEIRLLVPTRDEELPFYAGHKDEFAAIGTLVMVAPPEVIETCRDKREFVRFCRRNGFAIPVTYENPQKICGMDYPLFIKPRYGKGGSQSARLDSKAQLEAALKDMPDAVIQEFINAPEYTIDLFADFEGSVISVIPRLREHIVGGESYVSRTEDNPVIIKETIRLAQTLGLVGHNTIQCFLEHDNVRFIEVNPRFGGGAGLGFAAGADTPLFLVKLLNGETLEPQIGEFKDNYVMLRYTENLFMDEELLTGKLVAMKAVLFDLDNTLYPEFSFVRGGFEAVARYLCEKYNLNKEDLIQKMLDTLRREGRGRIFDLLIKDLQLSSEERVEHLVELYRSHKPELELYEDTAPLLERLKENGFLLGIITDGLVSVQKSKVAALGIADLFEVIVYSDELGIEQRKPSAAPYRKALEDLRVTPQEAAYIGDDPSKDFIAPNKMGMLTVQVKRRAQAGYAGIAPNKEAEARYTVGSLAEILPIIEENIG